MCGRYYVDDETAREIEKLVRQIGEKKRRESMQAVDRISAGDIYPGENAPVLSERDGSICCGWQHWGFPGFHGKKLIFNARCESALEKPLFRDSIRHRRIVIPAPWFYEWNPRKEKNTFRRKDMPVLFMAGFCRRYEDGGQEEMESQTKTVKNVQAERTVKDESGTSITQGSEIEAGLYRWLEPETSVQVAKGGSKHIYTNVSRKFDENLYEYYNDNDHVFSSMLYNSSGTSIKIDGNTSSDTKIIADDLITEWGFFEGFDVQVGEDETAEEITITVSLGEWSYYLRNKETGEIIHVSGNDGGRKATVTLKIVDVADEFSFTRELIADKASVDYGEETAVRMGYRLIYDANKYTIYNDTGHFWYLGIKSCIVSGNMSENTKIEDRKDYANTRYLVVGEDETAEELTITMECSGWTYWLKNKETEELLRIHSDESESLQIVIRVGAEKTSDSEQGEIEEKEIFTGSESGTEEEDAADDSQQITFANTVTGAGGIKIVSTIDGIYQVTDIAGVAVTTPKEQVETAAGITAGDGKVKFYVCNNRNQAVRTALEEAAASNGKQALTTFNLDLYAISMAGQVNKIYNTASKVKVVIGIPDKYKKSDGSYAVGIIGRDGTFHILEDLDNDPNTITIETDQFGIMALMKG